MKALTQFYSVDVLVIGQKRIRFDEPTDPNLGCQMIPLSPTQCQLLITNADRALDGILDFATVVPVGDLKHIEYTIIGSPDGAHIGHQRYEHKFTTKVRVSASGTITAERGALFLPYQMDVLLDSKAFGKVQGIQFIA
jgi:hypothetical protein